MEALAVYANAMHPSALQVCLAHSLSVTNPMQEPVKPVRQQQLRLAAESVNNSDYGNEPKNHSALHSAS